MFRMIKVMFMMAAFVALAWFGSTVKLGDRTLFGHLRAIGNTKESQELVDGTKQSAKPLVDDVRRRIAGETTTPAPPASPAGATTPDAGPPQETVTAGDRRRLRRLIGAADQTASAHR
jgi:hypothetical protein